MLPPSVPAMVQAVPGTSLPVTCYLLPGRRFVNAKTGSIRNLNLKKGHKFGVFFWDVRKCSTPFASL